MPVDIHVDGYLSMPECARHAHVTRQAIYIAMKLGKIPAVKIKGRWYITQKDLDAYRANKYNHDMRKKDGEFVFDMDKGHFSVGQVCKIIGATLGRPYCAQHLYYLLRTGRLKGFRKGAAWIISKIDAVALLDKEKESMESQRES